MVHHSLPAESFDYDGIGNHVNQDGTVPSPGGVTYRYDVNGDLKTRIDPTRAPSMPTVTYKYDALGRRVARIKGSEWTRYTYDGEDVVLDENSDGSLVYYGNGPGIDNKLWYQQGSSSPVFFLTDHLGSTRALVSSTGSIIGTMDYDSFGKPLGQMATRYQYAGREWDPDTELYYYRARWYDPQARRFISEDPIGLDGGINLYAYVENDPINGVDPSGLGKLPANPSGLGPQWTLDPSHKDPNGSRWVNPNGEYLDFNKAQPGKPGWRGRDHCHHDGCDKHRYENSAIPRKILLNLDKRP